MKKVIIRRPLVIQKTGRPSKYEPDILTLVGRYLKATQDTYNEITGQLMSVRLPSVEDFSRFAKVHRDTLYTLARENAEYRDALALIKQEQRERLINNGLAGHYNPTIAKLMLMTNHGMTERKETSNQHMIGLVRRIYEEADRLETGECLTSSSV